MLRDQQPLQHAAHAVTLVGYRCPSGRPADAVFIFRNSYGVNWGLGGCAFVAASYLQRNLTAAFYLTLPESQAPSPTNY
jgi:C1A family cysteine protease